MYLILALVFALIVAVFAVQNAVPVSIRFLAWGFETSLVYVILGSAALGALSAGLPGLFKQLSLRLKLWDTQSRLRKSEGELSHARAEVARLTAERQAEGKAPAANRQDREAGAGRAQ